MDHFVEQPRAPTLGGCAIPFRGFSLRLGQYTILILEEDRDMHSTQRNPGDDASPEFWAGRKVAETHKALLWQFLNDDPNCPSRFVLHALAETQVQISVTLRQINRWRKAWGLNRGQGRPRRAGSPKKI